MTSDTFPPGPRSWSPLANVGAYKRGFLDLLMSMRAEYGDFCRFRIVNREIFLVNDPEVIRRMLVTDARKFIKSRGLQVMGRRLLGRGLLTNEGEDHRRQRRLIQPAFTKQRIAGYADDMVACAVRSRDSWRNGAVIDMDAEMMETALAVAGRTMFGAEVESEAKEISDAMTEAMGVFEMLADPFITITEKLPLPRNKRVAQARKRIDDTVYRMIEQRRKEDRDRGDFLGILLNAREEGTGMTDQQVRDEAITLFLAGHETTANAMTWTWYLLTQHPEVQEKLHEEAVSVLGDREATADDFPNLEYTRRVFAESMRLYPPAHSFGRQNLEDYPVGDHVIPEGSTIIISPYVVHRHPAHWNEPDMFDPGRWAPEEVEKRAKTAYIPFGGGPRVCIGEPFAWMEGVLIIATIAKRWRFGLQPGHNVELQPLVTLRPRYGMRLIAHDRQAKSAKKPEEAA